MPDTFTSKTSKSNGDGGRAGAFSSYSRFASAEWRKFRNGFTRENTSNFFKTLAWVVPLTVLIWVYAEREQPYNDSDAGIAIEVRSLNPSHVITSVNPSQVMCTLRGPRVSLDRIEHMNPVSPVVINLPSSAPFGSQPVPVLSAIESDPRFQGIQVLTCTPDVISVDVDTLEQRTVPVEIPANSGNITATFSPASVLVQGPHQLLSEITQRYGHLAAIANLSSIPDLTTPGTHDAQRVSLSLQESSPNLTITPADVKATVDVHEANESYRMTSVPVYVLASGDVEKNYVINYDHVYPGVDVVGPREQIDLIRSKTVHPYLAIPINTEEEALDNQPKTLKPIDLPKGVELAPNQTLTLKITATPRAQ